MLGQLHHPNVVAFYGVVTDGPVRNLATVTEYMVNGSLKQVLKRKDRYAYIVSCSVSIRLYIHIHIHIPTYLETYINIYIDRILTTTVCFMHPFFLSVTVYCRKL